MAVTRANDGAPPRVVLLGPDLRLRQRLRQRLTRRDIEIVGESSIVAFTRSLAPGCDVLLVCLAGADDAELGALDRVAGERVEPMVFFESPDPDDTMIRRLADKLAAAASESRRAASEPAVTPASEPELADANPDDMAVWVLAASFGGPEAIAEFLASLPETPRAAFLVAQHIGDGFAEVVAHQLHRSTKLNVMCAAPGMPLHAGRVYVAPIRERLSIDEAGRFQLFGDQPPDSVYAPSIDDIIKTVAARYRGLSGAIIFTGMASDGANGAQLMRDLGGTVWAQDPESCAASSMPDTAFATGAVSHRGPPQRLAMDLSAHIDTLNPNHQSEQTA